MALIFRASGVAVIQDDGRQCKRLPETAYCDEVFIERGFSLLKFTEDFRLSTAETQSVTVRHSNGVSFSKKAIAPMAMITLVL